MKKVKRIFTNIGPDLGVISQSHTVEYDSENIPEQLRESWKNNDSAEKVHVLKHEMGKPKKQKVKVDQLSLLSKGMPSLPVSQQK